MHSIGTPTNHRQLDPPSSGLLSTSLQLGSLSMSARVSRARSTQRVRTSEQPQPPYHVIAHDLFTDALARERARADRFDQPFVLLVIEVDKAARLPPSVWTSVIEALTVAAGSNGHPRVG